MNQALQSRQAVLGQIERACVHAQREATSVQLLAVSKTHPCSSLRAMYSLGQQCFGENYLQEAIVE